MTLSLYLVGGMLMEPRGRSDAGSDGGGRQDCSIVILVSLLGGGM